MSRSCAIGLRPLESEKVSFLEWHRGELAPLEQRVQASQQQLEEHLKASRG